MTQQIDTNAKRSLPLVGDVDIEAELRKFEDAERERLGLEKEERWVEDMANLSFTMNERPMIHLLIGGLTMAQDIIIGSAFRSIGYNVITLDCPDNDALRVGKEFGNRAQCNPTYFTVGNLVKFLIHLRDEKGMSTKDIVDKYVFLTAGACGPCRFGMYVTEYRKALRDAGFDGFRVMLFQQQGGIEQATGEESGLELNATFFKALVMGAVVGDVINGMGYRLRPFEVEPGATDRAQKEAIEVVCRAFESHGSLVRALLKVRKIFAGVKVDRLQPKPKVAIIGEFWAMTTEGDGNYALQRFLEAEGAEADIQFVTAWALYNIWEVRFDTTQREDLRGVDGGTQGLAEAGEYGVFQRKAGLWVADKVVRALFQGIAHLVGFYGYHLPDMDAIAEVAAPYYNNDLRGGEGHMEVGKLILNVVKNKANMTLSVKPFGCMPSSGVSDGVQSLITEKFPGSIYCAVETSGDGAVNFYSRVQMYLYKAKQAVQKEIDQALTDTGMTMGEVRDFLQANPGYAHPFHKSPHTAGSTVADLIYEVGEAASTTRGQRAWRRAQRALGAARGLVGSAARKTPDAVEIARRAAVELAEIGTEAARERVARVVPLIKKGSGQGIAAAAGGG